MKNSSLQWTIHKNGKWSQCSAWPRWYAGISNGRYGLGVVRETWGWRIMLGPWDACKFTEKGYHILPQSTK